MYMPILQRDGVWMGDVKDKIIFLQRFEDNTAILQVYPKRSGSTPVLSITYDSTMLYP